MLRAGWILLILAELTVQGHAASYSWSGAQVIPDNSAVGIAYSFTLSDPGVSISSVSVALTLDGGWSGDWYAYLSHGAGTAVLLNRPGVQSDRPDGYGGSGLNVTLASGAGSDIHFYQELSGPWAADGRSLDPFSPAGAFDAAPRDRTLDVFSGLDPNGDWTLFLTDCSGGGIATLQGWTVTVAAVPEPGTLALLVTGALVLAAARRRVRRPRPAGFTLGR
jgi:subtilisin-like proprotein convertase family protein